MLIKSKNLLVFFAAVFFLNTGAQSPTPPQAKAKSVESQNERNNEKYEILKRDRIDNTDVLAIPFDDSEVEDEEEINQMEKKETFALPHSK